MVNYDLPWNPNRIEQRFGRIHRIGQEEVCRLWNLVASNTREGEVFTRLLEKIEEQREAYGGKVFDVLGEAFTETPLRDLLLDAIQYGERARREGEDARGHRRQRRRRPQGAPRRARPRLRAPRRGRPARAAGRDGRGPRPPAPAALHRAGLQGRVHPARRPHRQARAGPLRDRQRARSTSAPAGTGPIATKYDRVTFDLGHVQPDDLARADLLAPGHPLHDAVMDEAIRHFGGALNRGTVLVSSTLEEPHLLVGVVEEVADATGESVARRFGYAYVDSFGTVTPPAPRPTSTASPHPTAQPSTPPASCPGSATPRTRR